MASSNPCSAMLYGIFLTAIILFIGVGACPPPALVALALSPSPLPPAAARAPDATHGAPSPSVVLLSLCLREGGRRVLERAQEWGEQRGGGEQRPRLCFRARNSRALQALQRPTAAVAFNSDEKKRERGGENGRDRDMEKDGNLSPSFPAPLPFALSLQLALCWRSACAQRPAHSPPALGIWLTITGQGYRFTLDE